MAESRVIVGTGANALYALLGDLHHDEHDAALLYGGARDDDPRLHKRRIGVGERRTAWLVNGVVYKVGHRTSNIYEHDALTAWREHGAPWAPPTSVWRFTDHYNDEDVVVSMPYLPDDGGEVDPVQLAVIRVVAPQTCRENYSTVGGHVWLIDGEDVQYWPPIAGQ